MAIRINPHSPSSSLNSLACGNTVGQANCKWVLTVGPQSILCLGTMTTMGANSSPHKSSSRYISLGKAEIAEPSILIYPCPVNGPICQNLWTGETLIPTPLLVSSKGRDIKTLLKTWIYCHMVITHRIVAPCDA